MRFDWWAGLLVLCAAIGCDQAVQDIQKAAEESAAEAAAEAKAAVEEAGAEAKADVEAAGEEARAGVVGAGEDAKAALAGAVGELANLKVGDVDVAKEATSLATDLSTTLGEIKDVETAKAALPKLEEVNLGLDKLVGLVDKIPEAARPALASLLKTHSVKITETISKVVAIEGVGEIVKPVLDQIVAKLSQVSGGAAAAEPALAP
jgi:hypothetical protein